MTNLQINHWSELLMQQTRDAIAQMQVTQDACIHFKHHKLGYAYATLADLMLERLILQAHTSKETIRFETVEVLLDAGWVVD